MRPGMCQPIGDPEKPLALLLVQGGEAPFTEREGGLFARVADFVFANVMRWEELEGVRRKSRQVSDLFVMLAQEKERLDFILRSVPVGLLLAEGSGSIAVANDTAAMALGLTEVELKENKIFSSRPAGRALLGFIEKARAEKRTVSTPYEMEGRWFQVQVVPWPGGAQFLVVTQDIQDWYQLNRLKEDLISIISHEVKNPLTAIVNAADLLSTGRTGPLTDAQSRIAALILDNGSKIRSLLDDVVRLSRVHHLGGERKSVPLKPVIQKLRTASQDTIQGKLLVWREELEDVSVLGEPQMLENLFRNLIGNAIKYSGIGGHVGVRLWADGGWAKFRVADDGPGIPVKERERLFSPFFRASNVREQVAGTGLGLVIAHNVAERMGGRLEVTSPLSPEDLRFLACPNDSRPGTAFQADLPLGP
jgi:signal transduction histidine kinase